VVARGQGLVHELPGDKDCGLGRIICLSRGNDRDLRERNDSQGRDLEALKRVTQGSEVVAGEQGLVHELQGEKSWGLGEICKSGKWKEP
jgi:hypothetical protein